MNTAFKSPLTLDRPLDFLRGVWELAHALERLSKQMERNLGITAPQRLVLRCLGTYPGMTATQLSELLHLDPGTISTHVRRLVQKRFVARRVDSTDRRRVQLALTPAGRELLARSRGTVEHAIERLWVEAGEDAVLRTKATLGLLASLIDEERPGTPGGG